MTLSASRTCTAPRTFTVSLDALVAQAGSAAEKQCYLRMGAACGRSILRLPPLLPQAFSSAHARRWRRGRDRGGHLDQHFRGAFCFRSQCLACQSHPPTPTPFSLAAEAHAASAQCSPKNTLQRASCVRSTAGRGKETGEGAAEDGGTGEGGAGPARSLSRASSCNIAACTSSLPSSSGSVANRASTCIQDATTPHSA